MQLPSLPVTHIGLSSVDPLMMWLLPVLTGCGSWSMEAAVRMHEFSQHQSKVEKILAEAERTGRPTMDTESTGSPQNQWPYKGGCMYSFKSALTMAAFVADAE